MAQVLGPVEQQHRALADDWPEHRVGLARVQAVGGARKTCLTTSGSKTMTNRGRTGSRRHDVAVAAAQASMKRAGETRNPSVWTSRGAAWSGAESPEATGLVAASTNPDG